MNSTMIQLGGVPPTPRLDEYFGLWAVEDGRFSAMFERVSRMDLQLHVHQAEKEGKPAPRVEVGIALDARAGPQSADPQKPFAGLVGIAVINVSGVLMKQVGSLEDGTSTVALRQTIRSAARAENITGILLAIDSPGGTVAGTADLAAEVEAAKEKKPVWAYVEDLCASAAMWVASAATKIFANNEIALVGSIGTYAGLYDLSGAAGMAGIKAKLYKTGPLKGAGFPGTEITAQQDQAFQAMVDQTQVHFSAAIQKNRKLSDAQMKDATTGGIFLASEAKKMGLIDGIQTLDATISAMETSNAKQKGKGMNAAAASECQCACPECLGGDCADCTCLGCAACQESECPGCQQNQNQKQNKRKQKDAAALLAAAQSLPAKETAMSESQSPAVAAPAATSPAPSAPPVPPPAASLGQLKKAAPGASAEFLMKCLEEGCTEAQAKDRHLEALSQENAELKARARTIGGKGLTGAAKADTSEDPETAFKAAVDTHLKAGMPRAKAWSKAVREDPEGHAAYLAAYNQRHRAK